MTCSRLNLRADDGMAMYLVMMVMMVLLTLGAALSIGGHQSSTAISQDELGVRALQAAEAGAQAAVHRMNMQQPDPAQCIETTVTVPAAGSWCTATSPETVASNASYTYQTSIEAPGVCTGSAFGSGTVERCVVSIGSAGGVTRRVVQRVVSSSGADPFPTNGILGKDGITLNNNTTLLAGVGTNGQLSLGNNSSINGTVTLWQNAPAPSGFGGTVNRTPTQFVLAPPNMLNPSTLLDSKTSNDNGRLLAGANPADSCSGGNGQGGTCYRDNGGTPRQLSLGNQGSVTLGGGVYNFCQINIGNGAAVNVAAGARVLLYIDSPNRPGSLCANGQGGITAGNNAVFSNPTGDPRALQIVIYGSTFYPNLEIPNNTVLAAAIYAWNTGVSFKNNGTFTGAISAKTVTLKNNATWDNRLDDFRLATTLIYYRGAWRQCSTRTSAPANAPTTGCL